jgi:hypothetical protein
LVAKSVRLCSRSGVEYANWLFSTTKMHGRSCTAAMLMASWKSPREVEPSPQYASATRSSPRYLNANAPPIATG